MDTQNMVTCTCGAQNPAGTFKCQSCGAMFDGSAGNTVLLSRRVTVPRQSVRTGAIQGAGSFHPPIPRDWAGRPPVVQQKPEVKVAIVGFSEEAEVRQTPVPPDLVRAYFLKPDSSTNEAAGLRLAGELWQKYMPNARANAILLGDGEPTSGGGFFGSDKEAALKEAHELKQRGARIATIGVHGSTMDFKHLQSVASTPALAFDAHVGGIARVFVHATQTVTSHRWGQTGAEFVAFVIDESGSMAEDNKKTEVEEAVNASIALLQRL